jgi:hypothetical protein
MTSMSRYATSTLQVGHACGQPFDRNWGDEPTLLTLQVGHAWGKPNIRQPFDCNWGDEPTALTFIGKVRSGNEPESFPPKPSKAKFEDTGVGGKKHPVDVSACTPKISDISDSRKTKALDRNGKPYYQFLDEEPEDKTGGSYKFWAQLKKDRETPNHATLLEEFLTSSLWSAPTGIDPSAPPASKPPPKPRNPKVEDTGVGGKKHPIDLSTDESDVPASKFFRK